MNIQISDINLKRILSVVNYPLLQLEDLVGDLLTMDDLKEIMIWPAMQEYFEVWPLGEDKIYNVGLQFEIPFPDEFTFGIKNHKFIFNYSEGGRTASPFMNSTLFRHSSTRKYGTRNHYDFTSVNIMEEAYNKTSAEQSRTSKLTLDRVNKKVTGYNNMGSKVEIIWAKYSDNFDNIPFEDLSDVIKLSQANVLQFFGDLRNQESGSLPVDLNGSDMLSRARDLRQEVTERWRDRPKGMILR